MISLSALMTCGGFGISLERLVNYSERLVNCSERFEHVPIDMGLDDVFFKRTNLKIFIAIFIEYMDLGKAHIKSFARALLWP